MLFVVQWVWHVLKELYDSRLYSGQLTPQEFEGYGEDVQGFVLFLNGQLLKPALCGQTEAHPYEHDSIP